MRATKLFYCYAHEDKLLRDQLAKQLAALIRLGLIAEWCDRDITAGKEWQKEIDEHLNAADIILLLISPDFIGSDYCYSREMLKALERHYAGNARVIPVILRPADWKEMPFGKLQALPAEGKPITSWRNRDKAFFDIVQGISKVIEEFNEKLVSVIEPDPSPSLDEIAARNRYLEGVYKRYSSVMLPAGPAESFSLQAVFQPLKLRRDPLAAEDLVREERRVLLSEVTYPTIGSTEVIANNGDDALDKSPQGRMIVLGGPGTGKTTLLKYLVSDRAQKAKDDPSLPIPIFISLPNLAHSGKTLKEHLAYIVQDMLIDDRYVNILWRNIDNGRAFICLDGLDEIVSNQRAEMIKRIVSWASRGGNIWIIGSRFTSYKGRQLGNDEFTEWELQPLDHALRQELAQRLFLVLKGLLHKNSDTNKRDSSAFVDALEGHPQLVTWGKNPLLFSLAALTYVRLEVLPSSQVTLYQEIIDAVLRNREEDQYRRKVLYHVLASLALRFYQTKGRIFTLDDLLVLLTAIHEDKHETWGIDDMAQRVVNSGVLEVVAKETYGFIHQTFQEYLAATSVVMLPRVKAEQAINQLIDRVNEPFCRQVLVEFAYLSHQKDRDLEDYLYQNLMACLGVSKLEMNAAQREGRTTSGSAIAWGIDDVLQNLVDHWGLRLCATLESGSPDRPEDQEVASTIAAVFERNPRQFAASALIAGMNKYSRRGRCIGALGQIGTEQVQSALFKFTQEQIAHPSERSIFRYLASALGRAHVEQAIPLLQAIRDDNENDSEARYAARRSLWLLGEEKNFEDRRQYQIEDIFAVLTLEDEKGRPSDWTYIAAFAHWLQQNGTQDQVIRDHLTEIIEALQKMLLHVHDGARKPVIIVLGELGSSQTFDVFVKHLARHIEPSDDVAILTLFSLARLAERNQIDPTMHERIEAIFSSIRLAYPMLEDEANEAQSRIREALEKKI